MKLLRLRNGVVIEAAADAAQARSNRDIARMEAILKEMREAIGDAITAPSVISRPSVS